MTVVDCAGEGRARGRAHGEAARELVRGALQRWAEATGTATRTPVDRYVADFLASTDLLSTMTEHLPDLVEEIRGIADGANVPFETVAAYNLMDEQWWYDAEQELAAERGCSVVAFVDDSGVVMLTQNMDLPAFMDGSQLVLRVRQPSQPETLILSAAGLIGLAGVNAAGLGICVNTLASLRHARRGLPVAAILRGALRYGNQQAAAAFLRSIQHASGQHYAVADPTGIMGLECSAGGTAVSHEPGRLALVHTNHPLASTDTDARFEAMLDQRGRIGNSKRRQAFLTERVGVVAEIGKAKILLEDRSTPICVVPVPGRDTQTFAAVAFTLTDMPTAEFRLGLPGSTRWRMLDWTRSPSSANEQTEV